MSLLLRANTQDESSQRDVVARNSYRLPKRFTRDDVIVDIGANIGAFAYACLTRGAGRVSCFEPEFDCFKLLQRNVKHWEDNCDCHLMAVWRDSDGVSLYKSTATAMHHTLGSTGMPCPSISLDEVLKLAGPRVRLLKLDCEGAEKAILDAVTSLAAVEEIVGEIHYHMTEPGHRPPSDLWLRARLDELGFSCEIVPDKKDPDIVALFFGRRVK